MDDTRGRLISDIGEIRADNARKRLYDSDERIADYLISKGWEQTKHGWWICRWHDDGNGKYPLWHCSSCDVPNVTKRNYCPNCGAKMDGDGNG